jgi:hypothetical protein
MMTKPKLGDALSFGLSFFKRDPQTALVMVGLMTGAYALYFLTYWEFIANFFFAARDSGAFADATIPTIDPLYLDMIRAQGFLTLAGFALALVGLMFRTAMMRVLVRGDQPGLRNVQLWGDELRVAVVHIVGWAIFIGAYLGFVLLFVGLVFGGAALGGGEPHWSLGIVALILIIALIAGASFAALGMAGAIPLTVHDRQFNLFGGFAIVKRYGWSMVGAHIVAYFLLLLVTSVLALAGTGLFLSFGAVSQFFEQPELLFDAVANAPRWQFGVGAAIVAIIASPFYVMWWGLPGYFAKFYLDSGERTDG